MDLTSSLPANAPEATTNTRVNAGRVIKALIETFPTDILDAVLADVKVPSKRVTAADRATAERIPSDITPEQVRDARVYDESARAMHKVAAALLLDAVTAETAGSGHAATDAREVITRVVEQYTTKARRA